MGIESDNGLPLSPAAQRLKVLLEGLSGRPLALVPESARLGEWFAAWREQFPSDEACLQALAEHDLRMLICTQFDWDPEDISQLSLLLDRLPKEGKRRAWEEIRGLSEWELPQMGMPAWAQTVFGVLFIAGFVLPFVHALWGSLVLPVVVPLSFLLERKWVHLAYPSLEAMARRMVLQNKPGIELGKFAPEDLERVFFELAGLASGMNLDPKAWRTVEVSKL